MNDKSSCDPNLRKNANVVQVGKEWTWNCALKCELYAIAYTINIFYRLARLVVACLVESKN